MKILEWDAGGPLPTADFGISFHCREDMLNKAFMIRCPGER